MKRGQKNNMIDHSSLDEDRNLFDITKVDIKYNSKEKMNTGNNITMTIDHSLDAKSESS
jgi:hypothetical protein